MAWERVLADGFEGEFYDWEDIGELTVPAGWMPVWVQGTVDGRNDRPEYDREQDRTRGGGSAAKICTTHASHDGALVRRVAVRAGELVRVVAWGATWRDKCGQGLRVGLDPEGGLDHESESVIWSRWWSHYDPDWVPEQFVELSAAAQAVGDEVTVFLASRSDYAARVIAAYWDDVVVEQEGGGGPGPGPGPLPERVEELLERVAMAVERIAAVIEAGEILSRLEGQ